MFELRTYTAAEGKFDQLVERFKTDTIALFDEHNIETVGFWTDAQDENKLHYLVKHHGKPRDNWTNFVNDLRWAALLERTEQDGKLAVNMESVFMKATDFSKLQ